MSALSKLLNNTDDVLPPKVVHVPVNTAPTPTPHSPHSPPPTLRPVYTESKPMEYAPPYGQPMQLQWPPPQEPTRYSRQPDYAPGQHDGYGEPSRKRRRGDDEEETDADPKRCGLRKHQSFRRTPHRYDSPQSRPYVDPRAQAEEERRLASSDLSDCEEIWMAELSDYKVETQKRKKQVSIWFDAHVLEVNSTTAMSLSRQYSSRLARIRVRPPTPPHIMAPPPMSAYQNPPFRIRPMSPPRQEKPPVHSRPPPPSELQPPQSGDFGPGAADAADFLEQIVFGEADPVTTPRERGKGKESYKRPAASDSGSDLEIPVKPKHSSSNKRRKTDQGPITVLPQFGQHPLTAGPMDYPQTSASAALPILFGKGKGKAKQPDHPREGSLDSVSAHATPKSATWKRGSKKPLAPEPLSLMPGPAFMAGDLTPSGSRPASPAPLTNAIIFELDEHPPPLKKAKKVDDVAMRKRVKTLEEAQRKVWTAIARRDVAKVYKFHVVGQQTRLAQSERIARLASMQARKPFTRTAKANKEVQNKSKRLMREMLVFWKKNEREERDARKREQKEALDREKVEEEKREAARQARKLEFLISQTELYSHFVGNKLKTAEVEGDGEEMAVPAGADVEVADPDNMRDINFDEDDQTNLHRHAKHNAQEAIALAKQRAHQFDTQAALERKTNEAIQLAKGQAHVRDDAQERPADAPALVDLDSDELNFQNPSSLSGPLTIQQPKMLQAQLKEYQLKGLNWLATLYEQGINGILADEMGLGKTIQSISLMAYLAETHDIWGPFLVVAPASTLHNWQQELTRFVPGIKALPYWGNVKDRATLRKFWSKKEISYNQDAPFHVLITSYQLVTQDQQYFQRVKWQYMILDEAQNIKNSASVRWKTLLGFQCRNRLLLTGTPIQNSMQELWALLHFIMPSLFDSHDEFNEWFSKDIESAAENKGSKLNEHQLRRLHMILKPFMLRRVKRHVQNELSEKIELDLYVDLSARQRGLYKSLLSHVSVAELLENAQNIGDADSARTLMNLVMQFRKVCNHPELFERADVVAPFSFTRFGRSGPLIREGDFVPLEYSTRNPIEMSIPTLFYLDGGLLDVPSERSTAPSQSSYLTKMMNIWTTDYIQRSIYDETTSGFSFLRLLDMSPSQAHSIYVSPLIQRRLLAIQSESIAVNEDLYTLDPFFAASSATSNLRFALYPRLSSLPIAAGLPELQDVSTSVWNRSCLSRPGLQWFIPPVVAPPIALHCVNRTFLERQSHLQEGPVESLALYGIPQSLQESEDACAAYQDRIPGIPPIGLVAASASNQLPLSSMHVPEAKRLIYDSGKLAQLDALLQELKQGDHRVLVYFQMTRMMDLMEEYLIYRQYKYLRLDGSSKLEDRRDMVIDWQTKPELFVFLLSTRAGGLGINLTAADTVVFYDSDWNPSNDAQAMDRAHRLGQTRQVTVYRLITRGTIDERIVQLARVKKDVQDLVVGAKSFTDAAKPSDIVHLLLNDEQLASLNTTSPATSKVAGKQFAESGEMWDDEGDDFFGSGAPKAVAEPLDDSIPGPSAATRGRKRKGVTGASRGRKVGSKNIKKAVPPK